MKYNIKELTKILTNIRVAAIENHKQFTRLIIPYESTLH